MISVANYWLVILPVLFGIGWLASNWERRLQDAVDNEEQIKKQKSTFKGLNLLLNEQPDKAIDALVEVVKLDPETTELHFALGSLFRRRGETERAIRIHQHLVGRVDLKMRDRNHAAYELGRDFLRAGMLDRAEASLNQVSDGAFNIPAKVALLEMYQIEKDWRKAIIAANELQLIEGKNYQDQIAHFYCEIAQESIRRKDFKIAEEAVQQSLNTVENHIRAITLKGELRMLAGRPKEAILVWTEIEKHHASYLHLIADKWMSAHAEIGQEKIGLQHLKDQLAEQAGGELLDIVYRNCLKIEGAEVAEQLMSNIMLTTPSLVAMTKRLESQWMLAKDANNQPLEQDIKASLDLLKLRTSTLVRYTCSSCGFRAKRFYWQCPGCNHWDVYSPKRSEGMSFSN
jgi:lipopolysaccharide biosynthesis regulator YciM